MSFAPYATYKGSDVPWLGELPGHWEVLRLKEVSTVTPSNIDKLTVEGELPVSLCNYVDVYRNDRITAAIEFMQATASKDQIKRLGLAVGDVVVTKDSESPWDIAVPTVIAEEIEFLVCGYHLTKLAPYRIDGRFLAWALRAYQVNLHFALSAGGITRYGLSSSGLADGNIPVPPPDEQQAIADYLDTETVRIDALIREKEGLVRLLGEWRQSEISTVLLGGVDGEPLRYSGTTWLGDIPQSWTLCRLKHAISTIEQGWSPECENRLADADEWGVLKAGACNHGMFSEVEHKALPKSLDPLPAIEVRPGDVLMSRASGSADLVGSVAYVEQVRPQLMLSDKMFRLVPEKHVNARYLAWSLNTVAHRRQILNCIRGSSGLARNITTSDIKELWLALPPLETQQPIVTAAIKIANEVDELIDHAKAEIKLLKELRAATIADAVLGRVDVRTACAL